MSRSLMELCYWGATGSYANPLRVDEINERIVSALEFALRDSAEHPLPDERDALRRFVAERLPATARSSFGRHTTCIEIRTPEAFLIMDAGSGLLQLQRSYGDRFESILDGREVHLMLSHAHWDHISALPFSSLLRHSGIEVSIWATADVWRKLDALLSPTSPIAEFFFPITSEEFVRVNRCELTVGQDVELDGASVRTYPLNHPGGATGFRVDVEDCSMVVATDHEIASPDGEEVDSLVDFVRGADLLYIDAQYTKSEYDGDIGIGGDAALCRHGWGHSPVEHAIEASLAAGVSRVHLGHHDPNRNDGDLLALEAFARDYGERRSRELHRDAASLEVSLTREGLRLPIGA